MTYVNTGDFVEILLVRRRARRRPARSAALGDADGRSARRRRRRTTETGGGGRSRSGLMRILVATDAWRPQVNGVVHTLERMTAAAARLGARVRVPDAAGLSRPSRCRPIPRFGSRSPTWRRGRRGASRRPAPTTSISPPKGRSAGRRGAIACERGRLFTTSYHTRFPEYVARAHADSRGLDLCGAAPFPRAVGRGDGADALDPRRTHAARLRRGCKSGRAASIIALFRPRRATRLDLPRPIFLYVGRVAVEKNLEALLSLDLPGSTVHRRRRAGARARSSAAIRTRISSARDSAKRWPHIYASADVFVFPSRTDTFGIVMIEAMASGLPVAGFPVAGAARRDRRQRRRRARRGSARGLPRGAGNLAREGARAFAAIHLAGERAPVPRQYRGEPRAAQAPAKELELVD